MPDDLLPWSEVVARLERQGFVLTPRSLRLYRSRGLIPRPVVQKAPQGGRTGYYPAYVIGMLRLLRHMEQNGYSLQEIKTLLSGLRELIEHGQADTTLYARVADAFSPGGPWAGVTGIMQRLAPALVLDLASKGRPLVPGAIEALDLVITPVDGAPWQRRLWQGEVRYVLRPFSKNDIPALAALSLVAGGPLGPQAGADELARFFTDYADVRPEYLVVAVQREPPGTVLGWGGILVDDARVALGRVTLAGPWVSPEGVKLGLGEAIGRRAIALARTAGAKWVDAFLPLDDPLVGLVERLGFVGAGRWWDLTYNLAWPPPAASRPLPGVTVAPVRWPHDAAAWHELYESVFGQDSQTGDQYPGAAAAAHVQGYLAWRQDQALGLTGVDLDTGMIMLLGARPGSERPQLESVLLRHALAVLRELGFAEARAQVVGQDQSALVPFLNWGFQLRSERLLMVLAVPAGPRGQG